MFLVLGLYLTIGLRFFQFRRFGDIMRNTIGTLFRKKDTVKKESGNNVSSFGAFATALGSTVGNGNIAGVASAIAIGGPGAIFWMWMCALVGMATKMSEIVLTQTYKQKDNTGISRGSAAYYIQKGLVEEKGWKWCKVLSVVFTVAMLSAFYFTPGPYVVAESVQAGFNLSATGAIIFSFIYVILQFIIILGGIKRIIKFAESAVPFMVVAYFGVAFFLILKDIPATIEAFKSIFYYAFNPTAAVGGFAGASIIMTLQVGVARSVYSNEAGWGSAPIYHPRRRRCRPSGAPGALGRIRGVRRYNNRLHDHRFDGRYNRRVAGGRGRCGFRRESAQSCIWARRRDGSGNLYIHLLAYYFNRLVCLP